MGIETRPRRNRGRKRKPYVPGRRLPPKYCGESLPAAGARSREPGARRHRHHVAPTRGHGMRRDSEARGPQSTPVRRAGRRRRPAHANRAPVLRPARAANRCTLSAAAHVAPTACGVVPHARSAPGRPVHRAGRRRRPVRANRVRVAPPTARAKPSRRPSNPAPRSAGPRRRHAERFRRDGVHRHVAARKRLARESTV